MRLTHLLFPAARRHLPYSRWWNIAARTIHLAATGTLLGAHVFDVPADRLWAYLWVAIASGAVLIVIEVYADGHWLHQVCALMVFAKLGLLCLVPFVWAYRVPILVAVVVLAGVGAHAPRRVRHYSVVYRRVMAE